MTINHPVEWWQLASVLLVLFGFWRWYLPALVESKVAQWATVEREKQRAQIEADRQRIALARVGRFQAEAPPPEVSSGN